MFPRRRASTGRLLISYQSASFSYRQAPFLCCSPVVFRSSADRVAGTCAARFPEVSGKEMSCSIPCRGRGFAGVSGRLATLVRERNKERCSLGPLCPSYPVRVVTQVVVVDRFEDERARDRVSLTGVGGEWSRQPTAVHVRVRRRPLGTGQELRWFALRTGRSQLTRVACFGLGQSPGPISSTPWCAP